MVTAEDWGGGGGMGVVGVANSVVGTKLVAPAKKWNNGFPLAHGGP